MLKPLYGDVSHRFRVLRRVRSDLRALGASRTLIDAMRGRVTGKVCSMVCGYDKVKVRSDREAQRLEHASKAEAAMLDLTPIEPAAHYERSAVDRMFRKVPSAGCVCRRSLSL